MTRVLWLTLRADRDSYRSMNDDIRAAAARHPELTVVDWNLYSQGHPDWFQSDGLHLNGAGAQGMATLLHQALSDLGIPAVGTPAAPRRETLVIGPAKLADGRVGKRYFGQTPPRAEAPSPTTGRRVAGNLPPRVAPDERRSHRRRTMWQPGRFTITVKSQRLAPHHRNPADRAAHPQPKAIAQSRDRAPNRERSSRMTAYKGEELLHAVRFPGESDDYREARDELLEAEIELRRHTEAVAAQRRKLPLGGEVPTDYGFEEWDAAANAARPVRLSELFAEGKDTLFLYSFMFIPGDAGLPLEQAARAAPRSSTRSTAKSHTSRSGSTSRSSRRRRSTASTHTHRKRGWRHTRLLSSAGTTYNSDYHAETPEGDQLPIATVFTRADGKINHRWSSELCSLRRTRPAPAPRRLHVADLGDVRPDTRGSPRGLAPEAPIQLTTHLSYSAQSADVGIPLLTLSSRGETIDRLVYSRSTEVIVSWNLKGSYAETCSCELMCPCNFSFDHGATYDYCRATLVFSIRSGEIEGTDVSGLKTVMIIDTPKVMTEGNWRVGMFVDENATDEQVEKLSAVFGGQLGGPMEGLAPLVGEMLGVERASIEVVDDGLRHSVRVGDAIDFEIEDIVPFGVETGEPVRLVGVFHPVASEFNAAEAKRSHINAFGIEYEGKTGISTAEFSWAA